MFFFTKITNQNKNKTKLTIKLSYSENTFLCLSHISYIHLFQVFQKNNQLSRSFIKSRIQLMYVMPDMYWRKNRNLQAEAELKSSA